jgi:hypothetical protein
MARPPVTFPPDDTALTRCEFVIRGGTIVTPGHREAADVLNGLGEGTAAEIAALAADGRTSLKVPGSGQWVRRTRPGLVEVSGW